MLHRAHTTLYRQLFWAMFALCMALFTAPANALAAPATEQITQPYLGISSPFGRWNEPIRWYYNPTNAPAMFNDSQKMVTLIQEAMAEWEGVSGVRFHFEGLNYQINFDNHTDQRVVIAWNTLKIGVLAQAGPWSISYDDKMLGYIPYQDGSLEISSNIDWTHGGTLSPAMSANELRGTLVHELGHLIGLGHSDNPAAIMYANPYNNTRHLMSDDIAAAQAYYGPPTTPTTVPTFVPPTAKAPITSTNYLSVSSSKPGNSISTINDATPDSDSLYLNLLMTYTGQLTKDLQIHLVDPFGYVIREMIHTCQTAQACSKNLYLVAVDVLKGVPGIYHAYVIYDNQLVSSHTLTVTSAIAWNRPPNASLTMSATSGQAPLSLQGTVTAVDPEKDNISVTWHIPEAGSFPPINVTGATSHSMLFPRPGRYEIYASIKDDGSLYDHTNNVSNPGDAGTGIRGLLHRSVTVLDAVKAGLGHSVALLADGTVWTWGKNGDGQLGDGTVLDRSYPRRIASLTKVVAIAAGDQHTLALQADGSVWAWGRNDSGQLGNGATTPSSTPVMVAGLSQVVGISAGASHSLAVKADGSVWAWGANSAGQLGDNTTISRSTPVQVPNLTSIRQVKAGSGHSLALKTDGTVWAWGSNTSGQLGNNSQQNSSQPISSYISDIVTIDAASAHSMALQSNGSVWMWGDNSGQLGDGTTFPKSVPTSINLPLNVSDIATSATHSLAITADGTLWAWGNNQSGQLGDGTQITQLSPVLAPNLANVTNLASGGQHTLIAKKDGSVWAWGGNIFGQLGDGTSINRATPLQVFFTLSAIDGALTTPEDTPWSGSLPVSGVNGANLSFAIVTPP
ncbi:MAG: matrixin family metalloprotease, partial [Magnetococcales bacterium]|nr:matrixin family metalloprotease [Magnetococcales bacterium]